MDARLGALPRRGARPRHVVWQCVLAISYEGGWIWFVGENFVCAWIGLMLLPESGPADGSDLLACVVDLRVTGDAL